jgi:hypothetical protein
MSFRKKVIDKQDPNLAHLPASFEKVSENFFTILNLRFSKDEVTARAQKVYMAQLFNSYAAAENSLLNSSSTALAINFQFCYNAILKYAEKYNLDYPDDIYYGLLSNTSKRTTTTPHPSFSKSEAVLGKESNLTNYLYKNQEFRELLKINGSKENVSSQAIIELEVHAQSYLNSIENDFQAARLNTIDEGKKGLQQSEIFYKSVPIFIDLITNATNLKPEERLSDKHLKQISKLIEYFTWFIADQDNKENATSALFRVFATSMSPRAMNQQYLISLGEVYETLVKHNEGKQLSEVDSVRFEALKAEIKGLTFNILRNLDPENEKNVQDVTKFTEAKKFKNYRSFEKKVNEGKIKISDIALDMIKEVQNIRAITAEQRYDILTFQKLLEKSENSELNEFDKKGLGERIKILNNFLQEKGLNKVIPIDYLLDREFSNYEKFSDKILGLRKYDNIIPSRESSINGVSKLTVIDDLFVQSSIFGATALKSENRQNFANYTSAHKYMMALIFDESNSATKESREIIKKELKIKVINDETINNIKPTQILDLIIKNPIIAHQIRGEVEGMILEMQELNSKRLVSGIGKLTSTETKNYYKKVLINERDRFNFFNVFETVKAIEDNRNLNGNTFIAEFEIGKYPADSSALPVIVATIMKKPTKNGDLVAPEMRVAGLLESRENIDNLTALKGAMKDLNFADYFKKSHYNPQFIYDPKLNDYRPKTAADIILARGGKPRKRDYSIEIKYVSEIMVAGSDLTKQIGTAADPISDNSTYRNAIILARKGIEVIDYRGSGGVEERLTSFMAKHNTLQGAAMFETPEMLAVNNESYFAAEMVKQMLAFGIISKKAFNKKIAEFNPQLNSGVLNSFTSIFISEHKAEWKEYITKINKSADVYNEMYENKKIYGDFFYKATLLDLAKVVSFADRAAARDDASLGVDVERLRAIQYNAAITAVRPTLVIGVDELLSDAGKINGKVDVNLDEFNALYRQYITNPSAQKYINAATTGVATQQLDKVWDLLGAKREFKDGVVTINFDEGKNIELSKLTSWVAEGHENCSKKIKEFLGEGASETRINAISQLAFIEDKSNKTLDIVYELNKRVAREYGGSAKIFRNEDKMDKRALLLEYLPQARKEEMQQLNTNRDFFLGVANEIKKLADEGVQKLPSISYKPQAAENLILVRKIVNSFGAIIELLEKGGPVSMRVPAFAMAVEKAMAVEIQKGGV